MSTRGIVLLVGVVIVLGLLFFFGRTSAPGQLANETATMRSTSGTQDVGEGSVFPEFRVTDIDGDVVTRDSLAGKPSIVWFTTSWCVPCQIGAREVARLDEELGDDAFDVLVIFVDLRESNDDLRWWKDNFANKDWIVALDNEDTNLAERVDLKFLDTKFLLDGEGVIQNVDLQIADQEYLDIISNVISET